MFRLMVSVTDDDVRNIETCLIYYFVKPKVVVFLKITKTSQVEVFLHLWGTQWPNELSALDSGSRIPVHPGWGHHVVKQANQLSQCLSTQVYKWEMANVVLKGTMR